MTEQAIEPTVSDIWKLFRETDARFKETDTRLDKLYQQTNAQLDRMEATFTGQWGKFVEALVKPDATTLFRQRGIAVHRTYQRVESQVDGRTIEVDLILENDHDIVAIEVKSVLKVDDVREFEHDLAEFLTFFPKFAGYHIYGAVAGLTIEESADRYAYRRGLFVLGIAGNGMVEIKNNVSFRPHDFALSAARS